MDIQTKYSAAQMAVAVVIATEQPLVADILKFLAKSEIDALLANARLMKKIDQKDLQDIITQFEKEFVDGVGILNSFDQLSEAVSQSEANAAEQRETGQTDPAPKSGWDLLLEAEPQEVADYLATEHMQAAAYILSQMPPSRTSEIISLMGRPVALPLLARLMDITDVPPVAKEFVESALIAKFGQTKPGKTKNSGAGVAAILNEMNQLESESYLNDMTGMLTAEIMSGIKSMLFRFEDIPNLDKTARATVFDLVPIDMLTLALRDAPPDIAEAALSSIGQRSRRMIENDLRSKTTARPADIAKARRQIVAEVMRLASQGRIELVAEPLATAPLAA